MSTKLFWIKCSQLLCALTIFAIAGYLSFTLFDKIYNHAPLIIDEEFHYPLGEVYCRGLPHRWHSKVTTPPGLYVVTALLFRLWDACTMYWMRFTSFVASMVNLIIIYVLFLKYNHNNWIKSLVSAVNLSLLPPLYFFSHFYYTDVVSLTAVLLLMLFAQMENYPLAAFAGVWGIFIRQTNVIWPALLIGQLLLSQINSYKNRSTTANTPTVTFESLFKDVHLKKITFRKFYADILACLQAAPQRFWFSVGCLTLPLLFFICYVIMNQGIVLGDKKAHTVSLNLPQIFYFATFTLIFAWPYLIGAVLPFLQSLCNRILFRVYIMMLGLMLLIVFFNTVEHPYLLADNRHYIFYIWKSVYNRQKPYRYLLVPVYIFAIYAIMRKLTWKQDVSFAVVWLMCTAVLLPTHGLLELRYFLVPFVLFRLHISHVNYLQLAAEFTTHVLINYGVFRVFFNKDIYWREYEYPQKLIW